MYYEDNLTSYEIALNELGACSHAELLSELEESLNDLEFRQGRREYLQAELAALESAQRYSDRFIKHIENIRRGLRFFDCVDTADRANAILDLLSREKSTRELIGSWEH